MDGEDIVRIEFKPFEFYTEVHLVELTGESALSLEELFHYLKTLGGSVIYCHTFQTLLMHHFITDGFRNDFAQWVIDAIGDDELGERLASIDLIEYTSIRAYREKMIEIMEEHFEKCPECVSRKAQEARRFFFCNSISFAVRTGRTANSLEEFANHLRRSSRSSVFFHFIESRLRVGVPINDFSVWLSQSFGMNDLAKKINALDPYVRTLDELKDEISALVEKEL
ncbi:MAG: DUF5752 family protein [bacterium]